MIYTNIGEEMNRYPTTNPKNRLYHLTVTVYEADYSGTEGTGQKPAGAGKVLKLDSTKSE